MEQHNCLHCGNPIEKKSYESVNRYHSRKYCSQKCSKAYMRKHKIGWFKPSGGREKRVRRGIRAPSYQNEYGNLLDKY